MKALIVSGILLIGISTQALSMGHPHNMFAARKQMRIKTSVSVTKTKAASCIDWKHTVQTGKTGFTERLFVALSHIRPAHSY